MNNIQIPIKTEDGKWTPIEKTLIEEVICECCGGVMGYKDPTNFELITHFRINDGPAIEIDRTIKPQAICPFCRAVIEFLH